MYNLKSSFKRIGLGLTAITAGLVLSGTTVSAIPYVPGDNSNASPVPAFNVFTGVPNQGSESDFLRARVPVADGDSSTPYVDPLNASCAAGQKIQMKVYVHNGASVNGNNNGSGPSVAHGTKVKVNLPGNQAASFTPTATISASNAATVNDNVNINCNGKTVKLSYINGSAKQFSLATGTTAVSDSIVTTGAPIHSNGVSGDVWGCFDQRVYVILTVEIKETPTEKPKESLGECKLIEVKADKGRKVTAKVTGSTTNAQIVDYKINWDEDGVPDSNKQEDTHTYSKDGTYKITGSVKVKLANGTTTDWKSAVTCAKEVTFEGDKPPKVVTPPPSTTTPGAPKELIKTGPAGVAAVFMGVTGLSTFLYNRFGRRFGL